MFWRDADWRSEGLWALETIAFALTLGIVADARVLTKADLPWRRLADLHNLGTLTVWASSVGAAVATGVVTIILAGLQPFVLAMITPEPARPTPAVAPQPTASPTSTGLQTSSSSLP